MRGYFDEDEPEPLPRQSRDTELTLGFGTLMALFFGLVLLCGLCFGIGYEVGRGSAGAPITLQPSTASKSSATKPPATPPPSPTPASASPVTPGDSAAIVQQSIGASSGSASTPQQQVRPALPAVPSYTPPLQQHVQSQQRIQSPPRPQPAPSASYSGQYSVRVAAVPNPEDGEILVGALRRRGYAVSARRESDNLIHVRIGPFSSRDDASRWRQRLLADGYNAIVEQ
ncbi:MAG: SPOR domain-containing protein [Terracidiphilus sp.]|nr:SPOR domain-containing protein [Terracidiphilus sp.]